MFLTSIFCYSGLTESLFLAHKDEYPEHEQASLGQLYHAKVCVNQIFSVNHVKHKLELALVDSLSVNYIHPIYIMLCRWKKCVLKTSSYLNHLGPLGARKELL